MDNKHIKQPNGTYGTADVLVDVDIGILSNPWPVEGVRIGNKVVVVNQEPSGLNGIWTPTSTDNGVAWERHECLDSHNKIVIGNSVTVNKQMYFLQTCIDGVSSKSNRSPMMFRYPITFIQLVDMVFGSNGRVDGAQLVSGPNNMLFWRDSGHQFNSLPTSYVSKTSVNIAENNTKKLELVFMDEWLEQESDTFFNISVCTDTAETIKVVNFEVLVSKLTSNPRIVVLNKRGNCDNARLVTYNGEDIVCQNLKNRRLYIELSNESTHIMDAVILLTR